MRPDSRKTDAGAFVISLDFELRWGMRDTQPVGNRYTGHILGARAAVPRLLDLFVQHDIAATWAIVGFLMAESREELGAFQPRLLPRYGNRDLDPYVEKVGSGEADDPLHFAPSLVKQIAATPRQEVATHTYSHFYCLEEGSSLDAFRADLASAVAIAAARGLQLHSMVFPRNQWDPGAAPVLREFGIEAYRGVQPGWPYAAAAQSGHGILRRAARLADAHLPLVPWDGQGWESVPTGSGLGDVRATCFLRPVSGSRAANEARLLRITGAMTRAARRRRIFHIWWHPHNFGSRTDENLAFLDRILRHYGRLREEEGFRSLTMVDVSRAAQGTLEAAEAVQRG
jgi:peptidoglycan/xylan/chitin deacetylase (PgdA/CDA1 family)